MKLIHLKRLLIPLLILFLSVTSGAAQSFERPPEHRLVKGVSKKAPGRKRQVKVSEPRSVSKAIRKQKAAEKKQEKTYRKTLKDDRERHLEIQSPEVRERIIQNRKEADTNYKVKKKAVASKNKKSARKYR
jgi:hypothetical protein